MSSSPYETLLAFQGMYAAGDRWEPPPPFSTSLKGTTVTGGGVRGLSWPCQQVRHRKRTPVYVLTTISSIALLAVLRSRGSGKHWYLQETRTQRLLGNSEVAPRDQRRNSCELCPGGSPRVSHYVNSRLPRPSVPAWTVI